jgi:hypothetical protein
MSTTVDTAPRRPSAARHRVAVMSAVSGLVATVAVLAAPVAAHAGTYCGQDPDPDLGNYAFVDHNADGNTYLRVLHYLTPPQESLYVTDARVFDNRNSPAPLTSTAQATSGQTLTLTVTSGLTSSSSMTANNQTNMFSASLSVAVAAQVTSSTSASVTVTVSPWGRVADDYGIVTYNVLYNLDTWQISDNRCWYKPDGRSPHNVSGYVATTVQEWQTHTYPIVNPYGVVPYRYPNVPANDLHAGSIVSMYSQYLKPPDQVTVQQGGASYQLAGSGAWYDSTSQINATLPAGLQPGPATLYVTDSQGLVSNIVNLTILAGPPDN